MKKAINLHTFQREVKRQCSFALIAAEDLDVALEIGDEDRVWYSVQSLLISVANISKLLWPSPKRNSGNPLLPERGKELRASLSVAESSPLKPKVFRNHFEHFDERLERWATSTHGHFLVDEVIGSVHVGATGIKLMGRTMIVESTSPEEFVSFLRAYDPDTEILAFQGEVYELRPVIEAVRELWQKASRT